MRTSSFLAAMLAATPLCGQQPAHATRSPAPDWLLPIQADGADAGAFWASGPTYKVRFDDGMTFYPVLGAAAPRNLPLAWRTESIAFAGQTMGPAVAAVARRSDWRYELARPGVTEAYDVLAAGVEQSFVLAEPAHGVLADLVIRGRVDTPLHCSPRGAEHAALRFSDEEGREVIEYGAAVAFDAAGRRLALTTAFADGRIERRVPAAWLRAATWPVTVDPITQRVAIIGSTLGAASYPTVAQDNDADRFALTDSRPVSAADYDLLLRLRNADWSSAAILFSELSTASTRFASISQGGSPRRWVLAFQRETASTSRVRVYFHDTSDLNTNSGLLREIPLPAGVHDAEPSLGPFSGLDGYLVVRRDVSPTPANTEASYPVGFSIDVQGRTIGTASLLHTNPGNNFDVEHVSISSVGGGWWMVVWQEYNFDNPNDDWDIIAHVIGGGAGSYLVLGEGSNDALHKLTPLVDGYATNWLVAYLTRANNGTKAVGLQGSVLRVQRFHWDSINGGAVSGPSQVVDFAVGNELLLGRTNRPLALGGTLSHWGLAWQRTYNLELRAARIGWDGSVAEAVQLEPAPAAGSMYSPSLCWDWGEHAFAAVYASSGAAAFDPLYSRRFQLDDRASATGYGTGCSGIVTGVSSSLYDNRPYAGLASYTIRLSNARASVPTVLFAGIAPTDLPLPAGGAGCRLLLHPAFTIVSVAHGLSAGNGSFAPYFPIPSSIRGADIYWQHVQLDQGNLWSSTGLRTLIY